MTAPEHRAYVGPAENYDLAAALQFSLMTYRLGMREKHYLLDLGCGSLRVGRLFIPYLQAGHYYGIEPAASILEDGIRYEIGRELIGLRQPVFSHDDSFTLSAFGRQFDFILAHSIFSHAAPWQVRHCLREAVKVMHAESQFAATMIPGETSNERQEWLYGPPYGVEYRIDDMQQMAADAGLSCTIVDWPHPSQTWLLFKLAQPNG